MNALWDLLKSDAVADARPGNQQLDQLLGELEGRLADYAGPVRAKALFYIAQADFRRANRDRRERAAAAQDALNHYERVVAENPPPELLHAHTLRRPRLKAPFGRVVRKPPFQGTSLGFSPTQMGVHPCIVEFYTRQIPWPKGASLGWRVPRSPR